MSGEQLSLFGPPLRPAAASGGDERGPDQSGEAGGGPGTPGGSADQDPTRPLPGQVPLFSGSVGGEDVRTLLEALALEAVRCRGCGLRDSCRGVVFGEGDPEAGIILVGEAPGGVEDELGRPFVGPAGQLLDKILLAVGFRREQVYITNTVLCRPPGNRVPSSEEMAACRPWLDRRLAIMKPDIMVCLGASAARAVLGRDLRITRDRGRWQTLGRMKVMPTFHPAALLRDPSKKRAVWEDMKAVRAEWERLRAGGPPEREGRTA